MPAVAVLLLIPMHASGIRFFQYQPLFSYSLTGVELRIRVVGHLLRLPKLSGRVTKATSVNLNLNISIG
jgi:hypothetical protein